MILFTIELFVLLYFLFIFLIMYCNSYLILKSFVEYNMPKFILLKIKIPYEKCA